MTLFVPVIKRDSEADTVREAEKLVRSAFREALHDIKVAEAVAPYKTDGVVTGHRVGDDLYAVQALKRQAAPHIKVAIEAQKLLPYREAQLLNAVLRSEFEMVKGKLTGNPSPRKQRLTARTDTQSGTLSL